MQSYIGLDVDPTAYERAQARIYDVLNSSQYTSPDLNAHMLLKNFKGIKPVIRLVEEDLLRSGVDGILMDLGMSSMQASLKPEDLLNSGPTTELGRVLPEYGKIVKARWLHSTVGN